jgi:hypothetical protein
MPILNPNFNVGYLLDEYGINNPQDYEDFKDINKKSSFCRRLFKLLENESEVTIHELKEIRNSFHVNLHYAISLNENGKVQNLPCATFLKKASFFASKTIVTFPFPDYTKAQFLNPSFRVLGRRNCSELELNVDNLKYDPFDGLLTLICQCHVLLRENCIKIIPLYSENQKKVRRILKEECELISANFELEKLICCFEEIRDGGLLQPHFSDIQAEDIVKIKRLEEEIYQQFEVYFHDLINKSDSLDQSKREEIFLTELKDLSKGVHQLMLSFDIVLDKSIRLKKGLQIFSALTILASICPTILASQSIISILMGSAGTAIFPQLIANFIQDFFINNYAAIQEYKKQDKIYLAWRMAYPETDKYFGSAKNFR